MASLTLCLQTVSFLRVENMDQSSPSPSKMEIRTKRGPGDAVVSLQVSGPFLSQLLRNTLFHNVEQSRGTTEKDTGKEHREEAKLQPEKEC